MSFRLFWFQWWDKALILQAFRHVGFVGGQIDPLQLADQNGFFGASEEASWFDAMRQTKFGDTSSCSSLSKSLRVIPTFMDTKELRNRVENRHPRSHPLTDDVALEVSKLIDKYNELCSFVETSPITHGILTVPVRKKAPDRTFRLREKGESMTTEQIHLERIRRADEEQQKFVAKEEKSKARQEQRDSQNLQKVERSVRFDICKESCVCGQNCDMFRM